MRLDHHSLRQWHSGSFLKVAKRVLWCLVRSRVQCRRWRRRRRRRSRSRSRRRLLGEHRNFRVRCDLFMKLLRCHANPRANRGLDVVEQSRFASHRDLECAALNLGEGQSELAFADGGRTSSTVEKGFGTSALERLRRSRLAIWREVHALRRRLLSFELVALTREHILRHIIGEVECVAVLPNVRNEHLASAERSVGLGAHILGVGTHLVPHGHAGGGDIGSILNTMPRGRNATIAQTCSRTTGPQNHQVVVVGCSAQIWMVGSSVPGLGGCIVQLQTGGRREEAERKQTRIIVVRTVGVHRWWTTNPIFWERCRRGAAILLGWFAHIHVEVVSHVQHTVACHIRTRLQQWKFALRTEFGKGVIRRKEVFTKQQFDQTWHALIEMFCKCSHGLWKVLTESILSNATKCLLVTNMEIA
mmetsp:Transcript_10529/g.32409  ORF Transcript_10529/g.32409 Transcript_10529/m.32409 type:complete len:417 (+) Transcript_10529:431-1681(+)